MDRRRFLGALVGGLLAAPLAASCAGLARPGGHITGIGLPVQELAGKRLEIIEVAVPAADRLAAFIAPGPLAPKALHDHEAAAHVPGVTLHAINCADRAQIDEAFRDAARARARALVADTGAVFQRAHGHHRHARGQASPADAVD